MTTTIVTKANGKIVTGQVDREDCDSEETQRLAFWHLRHLIKESEQYKGMDHRLYPNVSSADIECIYVMLRTWLNQDNRIAEMESFMARFNFPMGDGTKQNLLAIFQEEQDEEEQEQESVAS